MIFITGDTHGTIDFQKLKIFSKKNPGLTKKDYMIICGDFGGVWNPLSLDNDLQPYEDLNFTILFVDGNHENFDLLNEFPVEEWNGGKVHFIRPDIIHLMRGQVFTIEGKKFFTFGGATSIDKIYRMEGLSWWPEEVPSYDDFDEAYNNLEKHNFTVDYVITHACDERSLYYPIFKKIGISPNIYPENRMLNNFEENVKYTHWYFGHYHYDGKVNERKTLLYNKIIKLF